MIIKSKDIINQTVKQINDFQTGKIKPLKTGKEFIDESLLGGLRPSDVLSITALPFHGKTYLLEEICMFMEKEYPDVIFVHCQWEIENLKTVVRELSKGTGKSVKEVLNVSPDKKTKEQYSKIIEKYRKDNIYLQIEPTSPKEFEKDIKELIKLHPENKIIVTVDNIENLLLDGGNQKQGIDNLLQIINVLKKQHPYLCFILLNQLNRNLEDRLENPKYHFPRESDLYATGQLYKISDVLICKHIPWRLNIERYGVFSTQHRYNYIPDEFKNIGANTSTFKSEGLVFYHILKQRNVVEEADMVDLWVERMFNVPEPQPEENNVEKVSEKVLDW